MNPWITIAADAIRHPDGVETCISGCSSHENAGVMALFHAILNDNPITNALHNAQDAAAQILPSMGADIGLGGRSQ